MTLTLPKDPADFLIGRHEAQNIAASCHVAYWLAVSGGIASSGVQYHFASVHKNFIDLADALGYDVSRKAAPADAVAS